MPLASSTTIKRPLKCSYCIFKYVCLAIIEYECGPLFKEVRNGTPSLICLFRLSQAQNGIVHDLLGIGKT